MKTLEFKECLVKLVKDFLTLPEDVGIQGMTIDITVDNYPRIDLSLVKADSTEKAIKI